MTDYLVEFLETPLFKLGLTIFFSYVTWRLTEKLNPRFCGKIINADKILKEAISIRIMLNSELIIMIILIMMMAGILMI